MARRKGPRDPLVKTPDGRLTPPMIIVCKLAEIMDKQHVTGKQLSARTGISPDTITKLRNNTWTTLDKEILGRIAAALNVCVHDLYETRAADVWFPIRYHGRVTVHFGSTSFRSLEGPPREATETSGEDALDRQFIGVWDHRAFAHVYDYLSRTSVGRIAYVFEEHDIWGVDQAPTRDDFKGGNHIVFGSPVVNPFAEHAVCHGADVTSCTPGRASQFPFNFRWQKTRTTVSSFGAPWESGPLGIISTKTQEVVAERTVVSKGVGCDCGLIMTYRFSPPERDRRVGAENDDYIIIVVMGHSGCGTLASTRLLCDNEEAARLLYPEQRDQATFRVCTATYTRGADAAGHDNRVIRSFDLVPGAE